jgi:DNA-directed RNA polymerase specialized sigma24 family protein
MIGQMSVTEVLAIARLRQWAQTRICMKSGKVANYANPGRPNPKAETRRFDAAMVNVIDFERALGALSSEQQTVLVLHYRDRQSAGRIATALGCSVRKVGYLMQPARQALADRLDRLNLL